MISLPTFASKTLLYFSAPGTASSWPRGPPNQSEETADTQKRPFYASHNDMKIDFDILAVLDSLTNETTCFALRRSEKMMLTTPGLRTVRRSS